MQQTVQQIISRYDIPKSCVVYVATALTGFTIFPSDLSAYLAPRHIAKRRVDAIEAAANAIADLIESAPVKPDLRNFELVAKLVLVHRSGMGYEAGLDRVSA